MVTSMIQGSFLVKFSFNLGSALLIQPITLQRKLSWSLLRGVPKSLSAIISASIRLFIISINSTFLYIGIFQKFSPSNHNFHKIFYKSRNLYCKGYKYITSISFSYQSCKFILFINLLISGVHYNILNFSVPFTHLYYSNFILFFSGSQIVSSNITLNTS